MNANAKPTTTNDAFEHDRIWLILRWAYWLLLFCYFAYVLAFAGPFLFSWGLIWLVGLLALIFAPLYPMIGAFTYILVTYSVPRYSLPFHMCNNLMLPEVIAYFATAALILERWRRRDRIQIGGFSGWMMVCLWLALTLSAVNALWNGSRWDPGGIAPMGRLNQTILMFLLGVNAVASPIALWWLSITLLVTISMRILIGGFASVTGDHDLAYLIVVSIPFLIGLSLGHTKQFLARLTIALSMISFTAALLFTRNRGALVGLAGVILVLWFRSKRKIAIALCIFPLAAGAYLFLPWQKVMSRFAGIGTDQSSVGRLNVWHAAVNMITANPILGVGLGNFQDKSLQYGDNPVMGALVAHNNFLHIAGEGGLLALAAYIGLIGATFIVAMSTSRASLPWVCTGATMVEASMIGYVLAGLFLSRHDFALAYLVMGLASGLYKLTMRKKHDQSKDRVELSATI